MNRRWFVLGAAIVLVSCGSSTAHEATVSGVAVSDATSSIVPTSLAPTTTSATSTGVDTIKVSKCFANGPQLLIKASSSDKSAQLLAYRSDGTLIGEVQNGGGSRYGGTVMPAQPSDPVTVTIRSSSGGSITVRTTPFQGT